MPEQEGETGRKWFLAVVLACPPCLAAGLASMGGGLGAGLALKGLLVAATVVVATTALVVWLVWRRRRACPI